MTGKDFIVKSLKGASKSNRQRLWVKLNQNRLFGVWDQNIKAESMRDQTKEQLAEAEGG